MRQASSLREETTALLRLRQRLTDALELAELGDESLQDELDGETEWLEAEVSRRETQSLLSGEYDRSNALLAIHAGAGGTDSQDWAAMLLRMYLRWAEQESFSTDILDSSPGEEAGIKSATVAIDGDYAYGYLQSERGVHRLVRLSPFDSAHRRHTSFALVEVLPQIDRPEEVSINPSDIRIDTSRSAGAGGQNVQKNETAIRITHLPTGLVVTCQNERSQTQNRENAMRVLRARLREVQRLEQEQELAKVKGEHVKAEWGSQIRSYVLHPYQMVKDHRTGHEVGNATGVLDGNLTSFIDSFLENRQRLQLP
jgi:peptide chain release factor 2